MEWVVSNVCLVRRHADGVEVDEAWLPCSSIRVLPRDRAVRPGAGEELGSVLTPPTLVIEGVEARLATDLDWAPTELHFTPEGDDLKVFRVGAMHAETSSQLQLFIDSQVT